MSSRTFHRTVVTVEILSEDPIGHIAEDLGTVHHQITDGDWSGRVTVTRTEEIDGAGAARLLADQASDPGFFGLTDDGDDIDDCPRPGEATPDMADPTPTVQVEITGHDPIPFCDDTAVSFVVDDIAVLGVHADADGTFTVGTWDDGTWIPIHTEKTWRDRRWNLRVVNRDRRRPTIELDAGSTDEATERVLDWARNTAQLPEPIVVERRLVDDGRWQVDIEGW